MGTLFEEDTLLDVRERIQLALENLVKVIAFRKKIQCD